MKTINFTKDYTGDVSNAKFYKDIYTHDNENYELSFYYWDKHTSSKYSIYYLVDGNLLLFKDETWYQFTSNDDLNTFLNKK